MSWRFRPGLPLTEGGGGSDPGGYVRGGVMYVMVEQPFFQMNGLAGFLLIHSPSSCILFNTIPPRSSQTGEGMAVKEEE